MDFVYARLVALPKDWQVEGRDCEGLCLLPGKGTLLC